jgi:hypothetical protein
MRTVLFWDITQCVMVISYRHFVTTSRSHLQGSRIQKKTCGGSWHHAPETFYRQHSSLYKLRIGAACFLLTSGTLKVGMIGCPATSIRNHHYSLRNNTEDRRSQRTVSLQIAMKSAFSLSIAVPVQRALVGSKQKEQRMNSTARDR